MQTSKGVTETWWNIFLFVTAPETQTQSICSILSDMFSLGMVICAIFNQGRSLIQAGNSSSTYLKQLELVSLYILIKSQSWYCNAEKAQKVRVSLRSNKIVSFFPRVSLEKPPVFPTV